MRNERRHKSGSSLGIPQTALAFADQGVSSLTNVGVLAFLASRLDAGSWGAVAIAATLFSSALALARAAVGEIVLLGLATRRDALASASFIALPLALALAMAGLVLRTRTVGPLLLIMALLLPAIFVQDALRLSLVQEGKAGGALASDSAWLLCTIAMIAGVLVVDRSSPATLFAAWLAGAAFGLVGWRGSWRGFRGPIVGLVTLRTSMSTWVPSLGDAAVAAGVGAAQSVILGIVGGLPAVGVVRAALLLFGPLNVVASGLVLARLSAMARMSDDQRAMRRHVGVLSAAIAFAVSSWTLLLMNVPSYAGRAILGTTWAGASNILVLAGGFYLISGLGLPCQLGLRALGRQQTVLKARAAMAFPGLILSGIGSKCGPRGFMIGLLVGSLGSSSLEIYAFLKTNALPRRFEGRVSEGHSCACLAETGINSDTVRRTDSPM